MWDNPKRGELDPANDVRRAQTLKKSLCVHAFCLAEPPRRVHCLGPKIGNGIMCLD